ncbi:MAG: FUSC family protein [Xanthobacteraceae bacterium]|nr:FUSC family protein [Xanthobacteraceae bacterium]
MAIDKTDTARQSRSALVIGRVSIDAPKIRRGAIFLVNIGVPLVVGVARGESQAALAAVVVGMLLGFADNSGPLISRLRFLILDAGCIVAGGLIGYVSRDNAALLWPAFVAMALAVGMAPRAGRELLLAGRHAIMAFTVAAAIPTVDLLGFYYLAGVMLLAAATRTADYLIAGPLPRQPVTPLQMPAGRGGWLRFAVAFAGAATAALWLGGTLDPIHTIWVVTTTLVMMQADARASYRRIVERIAGTFAGVFVAWMITRGFHTAPAICVFILLVAPLIPHHLANRYWLHTALIALLVLLAYDLAELNTEGIAKLLPERVIDMLLGCAMALVGTAAAFPRMAAVDGDGLVEESLGASGPDGGKRRPAAEDDGSD